MIQEFMRFCCQGIGLQQPMADGPLGKSFHFRGSESAAILHDSLNYKHQKGQYTPKSRPLYGKM
jgi:hypothetical protein